MCVFTVPNLTQKMQILRWIYELILYFFILFIFFGLNIFHFEDHKGNRTRVRTNLCTTFLKHQTFFNSVCIAKFAPDFLQFDMMPQLLPFVSNARRLFSLCQERTENWHEKASFRSKRWENVSEMDCRLAGSHPHRSNLGVHVNLNCSKSNFTSVQAVLELSYDVWDRWKRRRFPQFFCASDWFFEVSHFFFSVFLFYNQFLCIQCITDNLGDMILIPVYIYCQL